MLDGDDKVTIHHNGCPDDIPQLSFGVVVHEPNLKHRGPEVRQGRNALRGTVRRVCSCSTSPWTRYE
jgi:hypothetical protein